MRKFLVATVSAVALIFGGSVATTATAAPVAANPNAAPILAAKAKSALVVKAKVARKATGIKDADGLRLLSEFIQLKDKKLAKMKIAALIGIKEGPTVAEKLWRAKKGKRVTLVLPNGKKKTYKVLKRVGTNVTYDELSSLLQKKTKAVIAIASVSKSAKTRVILLG